MTERPDAYQDVEQSIRRFLRGEPTTYNVARLLSLISDAMATYYPIEQLMHWEAVRERVREVALESDRVFAEECAENESE
jgi:hypothetical protein